jgi:hypothetical protein
MNQLSTGPAYCFGYWFQSALDTDGVPIPAQTYEIGCGYSNALPLGAPYGQATVSAVGGRLESPSFEIGARDDTDKNDGWWRDYAFSPGPSGSYGIASLSGGTELLATGYAVGGDCSLPGCPARSFIALEKVSRDNGAPVQGFGTNGAVLIPDNRCRYGKSDVATPSPTWTMCRIQPPSIIGKAKISGKRKNPSLWAQVTLAKPPSQPGALIQRVRLTLPRALRAKQPRKSGKLRVRVGTEDTGSSTVSVQGRSVLVTFTPEFDGSNPVDPTDLHNAPIRVTVNIARGYFKPLRKGVRIKRLRIPVRAAYDPSLTSASGWFSRSSRQIGLKVNG